MLSRALVNPRLVCITSCARSPNLSASRRGRPHAAMSAAAPAAAHGRVPPIVYPPAKEHKSSLIMIHGLGDTGEGWEGIGPMLQAELPHTKFLFPTAPIRPITINGGAQMPGWYDIASLDRLDGEQDTQGMRASSEYIAGLVQTEVEAGIPSSQVVVAGFSQGGAMSLLMLRSQVKLAGVLALSAYLPLHHETTVLADANRDTPILMCHGDCDPVVDYGFGQQSYEKLKQLGANIEFKTYRFMQHEARPDELQDVTAFLKKLLAPAAAL